MTTYLLLGLGNPGNEYAATRHNVGFRAVETFVKSHAFTVFKFEKKFRAEITVGTLGERKIIIAKPQTFMNLSGEAARALVDFYKIPTTNVIAVFDDKDLPFGMLRLRTDGGSGGHNGVKSLIAHLGANFTRVRVGVANELLAHHPTDAFVLSRFAADEEKALPPLLTRAADAATAILEIGYGKAANTFNAK